MPAFSSEHQKFGYLRYDVVVRYVSSEGKTQMPIAWWTGSDSERSGRETSLAVRTSKRFGLKVVTFEIIRMGALPVVPDLEPGTDEELLHYEITEGSPMVAPSGVPIYPVAGQYIFALLKPPTKTAGFRFPRTVISRDGSPATLGASQFKAGILGGGIAVEGKFTT